MNTRTRCYALLSATLVIRFESVPFIQHPVPLVWRLQRAQARCQGGTAFGQRTGASAQHQGDKRSARGRTHRARRLVDLPQHECYARAQDPHSNQRLYDRHLAANLEYLRQILQILEIRAV